MNKLTSLLAAGTMSMAMITPALAENAQPLLTNNLSDARQIFETDAQPMQLAVLSAQEMKETEGAWWPWIGIGVAAGIGNTYGYVSSNSNWSWGGATYAFGAGFGGGLIASLPGTTAYRIGYTALGGAMAARSCYGC